MGLFKKKEKDTKFYDVKSEPFDLYGFYRPHTERIFRRVPEDIAKQLSPRGHLMCTNTAGGRVRFSTDSKYIKIRCKSPKTGWHPHMAATGTSGFDLYIDEGGVGTYYNTFMPPDTIKGGYEAQINLGDRKMRNITINFPPYNDVHALHIGLQKDAKLGRGEEYRHKKPILFYGSSITQGACASRPGNSYQNIIAAKYSCNYMNLGFSGSAFAEDAIVNHMAELDFSIFVLDYDHNAPDSKHLENTHSKSFKTIRKKHPDTPVVMISKPDFDADPAGNAVRRDVIYKTYSDALESGDKNVYFIDGQSLFGEKFRDSCTVDACHPNDAGFVRMAEAIAPVLEKLLNVAEGKE